MSDLNSCKSSKLARITQAVLTIFGILGGIVTLVQIWQWWAPANSATVAWKVSDEIVFTRPKDFDLKATLPLAALNQNDIVRSEITIFRDGGVPIAGDQVRRPLSIHLPNGAFLLGLKVEGLQSALADNFQVSNSVTNDRIDVRWKFFDPDMAIKIVILRQGSPEPLTVTSNLGPGIQAEEYAVPMAKQLLLSIAALLSVLCWALLILTVWIKGTALLNRLCPEPWRHLSSGLLLGCATASLIFLTTRYDGALFFAAAWLAPHIVQPLPLS